MKSLLCLLALSVSTVAIAAPAQDTTPPEPPVRLTPQPSPSPRINGSPVFGVRPGSPFLFTIAATGDRPMKFSAGDLPDGLSLDTDSGRISGSIAKAGTYRVTLSASNDRGNASRNFTIVCGNTLALTPHMGWNSWYIWKSHVSDKIMRQAADAMVSSGMINFGYQYVNIDDCWATKPGSKDPNLNGPARNEQGQINSNAKFPDMKALTDYIHSKGLKAGIYSSPGPKTCAEYTASYQHEADDAKRFADWGFDFLKYDWCSYGYIVKSNAPMPEMQKPYRLIADELAKQPRDIVLNLCQYGMRDVWKWGKQSGGNSWRTAGDLGGNFDQTPLRMYRDVFAKYTKRNLDQSAGPGDWNDPDYILCGYLSNNQDKEVPCKLSPNEQYTQMSLWSIVAAPLIFSGDMTKLDDFTLGILCNAEVIDVDQDALGKPGKMVSTKGDGQVWSRELEDGSLAVGLFNLGEKPLTVGTSWQTLGIEGRHRVHDLWRQKDLGVFEQAFSTEVPRHGVVFVKVSKVK